MNYSTVAEVGKIIRGITFKPEEVISPDEEDAIVCMRTKNVQSFLDTSDLIAVPRHLVKKEDKFLQDGDILISTANSWNLVGKCCYVPKLDFSSTLGGFISGIRLNPKKADSRYFYHWLSSDDIQTTLRSFGRKTTNISNLDLNRLSVLPVPLPPLDEQKRIAGILDKADAVRRKRTESLKLLDELLRATFLDMFGDPITNPKGLKKKPLKDFGTVVTGNTPSRADAENYGDYIEWIKSDNLNNPKHFLTKATEGLSEKGARKSRLSPSGSILVTCIAGSPSCIGNAGIADREVAFNQQINAVTPFPNVDLYFLYTQILVAKKLIQSASTNAMKGMINKSKFENIRLLDADENTQKKAGKIFKKIIHEHSVFSSATTESDALFHSLVARAFKGEL